VKIKRLKQAEPRCYLSPSLLGTSRSHGLATQGCSSTGATWSPTREAPPPPFPPSAPRVQAAAPRAPTRSLCCSFAPVLQSSGWIYRSFFFSFGAFFVWKMPKPQQARSDYKLEEQLFRSHRQPRNGLGQQISWMGECVWPPHKIPLFSSLPGYITTIKRSHCKMLNTSSSGWIFFFCLIRLVCLELKKESLPVSWHYSCSLVLFAVKVNFLMN